MLKAIYLSPSTQEHNVGVLDYGTEERRMNQLADILQGRLRSHGILVYRNTPNMTHITSKDASNILYEAGKIAAHFALHSDAGGGRGTSAYTSGSTEGYRLSKCLYDEVAPLTPSEDRGIRITTDLTEVVKTKAPACLMEVAYHDLQEDAIFIMSHMVEIAEALTRGFCKYFDVAYRPVAQNYFRVQVGAFRVRANAEALLKKLDEIGIPGYITT